MGTRNYNRPNAAEIWAVITLMTAHSSAARDEFADTKGWTRTELFHRARTCARDLVESGEMVLSVNRVLQEWLSKYPESASRRDKPGKDRAYTKYVGVWLTPEDWEGMEEHRKSTGLGRSEYLRRAVQNMQARVTA